MSKSLSLFTAGAVGLILAVLLCFSSRKTGREPAGSLAVPGAGDGRQELLASSQSFSSKLFNRSGTGFPILMVGLFPHGGSVPWIHRCL